MIGLLGAQAARAEAEVKPTPISPVIDRLLECALDYEKRALSPRVAWDQMGAETWGKTCRRWFDTYKDVADKAAGDREIITKMRAIQASDPKAATGFEMIVSMDVWTQIDRILDPVDQDVVRGWIEVDSSHDDDRPRFRRMLGVNHCVAGLMRGLPKPYSMFERLPETDADWLARRRAWLGRYNPNTWVVRTSRWSNDGQATQLVGRVCDVIDDVHLSEPYEHRFAA